MAQQKGTIDWEAVGRVEDLRTILPFIPPEQKVKYLLTIMTAERLLNLVRQLEEATNES
ncbi:MAG: hypothetical protein ACRC33_16975 [Gemmataceae bacterium]